MCENAPKKRRSQRAAILDEKLEQLLVHMLEQDESITYRALVRGIDDLSAASSLTRDVLRRGLVERYQEMQAERRQWLKRLQKKSKAGAAAQLASRDQEIAKLKRQVELLAASHKAMLLAVGEMGGMAAWRRFFEPYSESLAELEKLCPP